MMVYQEQHWLSTGEAAARLHVSREWVRLLVQRDVLRAQKTSIGFLIDPTSVERYASQRAAEERAAARKKYKEMQRKLTEAEAAYRRIPAIPEDAEVLANDREAAVDDHSSAMRAAQILDRLAQIRASIAGDRELADDSTELLRQARESGYREE